MRMFIQTTAAITVAALASGCSLLARNYLPDPIVSTPPSSADFPLTSNGTVDLARIDKEKFEGPSAVALASRASFAAKLISLSNEKCELHKATIMSNSNNWNVSTGVATILFSGYAAVASSAATAAHLAAAASATTGVQGQVNQEIYQGKLSTAILTAIDSGRQQKYAVVKSGMSNANYTLAQLVLDINDYHESCSLMAGLNELTTAIGNRTPSKVEIAEDIKRSELLITNSTQLLEADKAALKAALARKYEALLSAK